jgi:hypothetical protein
MYIYALVSGELILYVGKSKHLKLREEYHRSKRYNDCGSRDIPDCIDWEMKKLEKVTEDIANIRERYYYDTLKPLYNINKPSNKPVDMTQKIANYIKLIENKMEKKSELQESKKV